MGEANLFRALCRRRFRSCYCAHFSRRKYIVEYGHGQFVFNRGQCESSRHCKGNAGVERPSSIRERRHHTRSQPGSKCYTARWFYLVWERCELCAVCSLQICKFRYSEQCRSSSFHSVAAGDLYCHCKGRHPLRVVSGYGIGCDCSSCSSGNQARQWSHWQPINNRS